MANVNVSRRVIVKFRDSVDLPYEDGAEAHVIRLKIGPWAELAHRFPGIRLNRLFTVLPPARIVDLVAQAARRDRRYRPSNLLTFFVIDSPANVDPEELATALQQWEQVEEAYIDPLDKSPAPNPDWRWLRPSAPRTIGASIISSGPTFPRSSPLA